MKVKYLLATLIFVNFATQAVQIIPWNKHAAFDVIVHYLPANPIIVEAGAFDGTDTLRMSKQWPRGTIFAFEPDPANFRRMIETVKTVKNVHTFPYALCEKKGTAIFYQSHDPARPNNAQSGSLLAPKEHLNYSPVTFNKGIEVPTTSLEIWCKEHGIECIDFLWLDMQGAELIALKAAGSVLKTVKLIFMEVELVEAYEGQALYPEVKEWLESQDFVLIAKDFKENQPKRWYGNIIMINKHWLKQFNK